MLLFLVGSEGCSFLPYPIRVTLSFYFDFTLRVGSSNARIMCYCCVPGCTCRELDKQFQVTMVSGLQSLKQSWPLSKLFSSFRITDVGTQARNWRSGLAASSSVTATPSPRPLSLKIRSSCNVSIIWHTTILTTDLLSVLRALVLFKCLITINFSLLRWFLPDWRCHNMETGLGNQLKKKKNVFWLCYQRAITPLSSFFHQAVHKKKVLITWLY